MPLTIEAQIEPMQGAYEEQIEKLSTPLTDAEWNALSDMNERFKGRGEQHPNGPWAWAGERHI